MAHRDLIASKNLDVPETSQDQETDCTKGIQRELASAPHLFSFCASAAQPDEQPEHRRQRRYRIGGTPYISVPQATNIIEAVEFAKSIDLPLVAHLTIHWAYTNIGDDPDGKRFDVRGWSVQARSVGPLFDGRAPRRDAVELPRPAPTSMTFSAM